MLTQKYIYDEEAVATIIVEFTKRKYNLTGPVNVKIKVGYTMNPTNGKFDAVEVTAVDTSEKNNGRILDEMAAGPRKLDIGQL